MPLILDIDYHESVIVYLSADMPAGTKIRVISLPRNGRCAKLAFEADASIKVDREEVHNSKFGAPEAPDED